jgi:hypothetical protein
MDTLTEGFAVLVLLGLLLAELVLLAVVVETPHASVKRSTRWVLVCTIGASIGLQLWGMFSASVWPVVTPLTYAWYPIEQVDQGFVLRDRQNNGFAIPTNASEWVPVQNTYANTFQFYRLGNDSSTLFAVSWHTGQIWPACEGLVWISVVFVLWNVLLPLAKPLGTHHRYRWFTACLSCATTVVVLQIVWWSQKWTWPTDRDVTLLYHACRALVALTLAVSIRQGKHMLGCASPCGRHSTDRCAFPLGLPSTAQRRTTLQTYFRSLDMLEVSTVLLWLMDMTFYLALLDDHWNLADQMVGFYVYQMAMGGLYVMVLHNTWTVATPSPTLRVALLSLVLQHKQESESEADVFAHALEEVSPATDSLNPSASLLPAHALVPMVPIYSNWVSQMMDLGPSLERLHRRCIEVMAPRDDLEPCLSLYGDEWFPLPLLPELTDPIEPCRNQALFVPLCALRMGRSTVTLMDILFFFRHVQDLGGPHGLSSSRITNHILPCLMRACRIEMHVRGSWHTLYETKGLEDKEEWCWAEEWIASLPPHGYEWLTLATEAFVEKVWNEQSVLGFTQGMGVLMRLARLYMQNAMYVTPTCPALDSLVHDCIFLDQELWTRLHGKRFHDPLDLSGLASYELFRRFDRVGDPLPMPFVDCVVHECPLPNSPDMAVTPWILREREPAVCDATLMPLLHGLGGVPLPRAQLYNQPHWMATSDWLDTSPPPTVRRHVAAHALMVRHACSEDIPLEGTLPSPSDTLPENTSLPCTSSLASARGTRSTLLARTLLEYTLTLDPSCDMLLDWTTPHRPRPRFAFPAVPQRIQPFWFVLWSCQPHPRFLLLEDTIASALALGSLSLAELRDAAKLKYASHALSPSLFFNDTDSVREGTTLDVFLEPCPMEKDVYTKLFYVTVLLVLQAVETHVCDPLHVVWTMSTRECRTEWFTHRIHAMLKASSSSSEPCTKVKASAVDNALPNWGEQRCQNGRDNDCNENQDEE